MSSPLSLAESFLNGNKRVSVKENGIHAEEFVSSVFRSGMRGANLMASESDEELNFVSLKQNGTGISSKNSDSDILSGGNIGKANGNHDGFNSAREANHPSFDSPLLPKSGSTGRKGFYARSPILSVSVQSSPVTGESSVNGSGEKKGFYLMRKAGQNTPTEKKIPKSPVVNVDDEVATPSVPQRVVSEISVGNGTEGPKSSASSEPSSLETPPLVKSTVISPLPGSLGPIRSSMAPKREGFSGFLKMGEKIRPKNQMAESAVMEAAKGQMMEEHERFSLLLLEEGEYYFRDHFCSLLTNCVLEQSSLQSLTGETVELSPGSKVAGRLKICSNSVIFVPQDNQEPVFRLSFANVASIDKCSKPLNVASSESDNGNEEHFLIKASEKTIFFLGSKHMPHTIQKGEFSVVFLLLHASLSAVLTKIQKLHEISKLPLEEKKAKQAGVIKRHEEEQYFNVGWFEKPEESVKLDFSGSRMSPLVSQPGRIVLTDSNVYFQPFNVVTASPVDKYKLESITQVMRRSILLEDIGLELFFTPWISAYFTFKSEEQCSAFHQELIAQPKLSIESKSLSQWQTEWVEGNISNFDYLMYLNQEGNRSFNDLSQYPVFPWVVSDYSSDTLDLTNPETFRDLSKPIGALSPGRLSVFKQQYREMMESYEDYCEDFLPSQPPPNVPGTPSPPYLYGCHYSTPGYVAYFKLRSHPQLMLRLQNGRFDMPDRLLSSIAQMWESATTKSSDMKELIPEFYSLNPSLLMNVEGMDFGVKQNGDKVDHVALPPWAENPTDFVTKMRNALESPVVSRKLHKWINLVFGCKQSGAAAIEADNVFHPFTDDRYAASLLKSIADKALREAVRVQMREFGRNPKQLFSGLHPRRKVAEAPRRQKQGPADLQSWGIGKYMRNPDRSEKDRKEDKGSPIHKSHSEDSTFQVESPLPLDSSSASPVLNQVDRNNSL